MSNISPQQVEANLSSMEQMLTEPTAHVRRLRCAMNRMRHECKFTDVIIVCGKRSFPAHRLVLVTVSSFFEELLKSEDVSPTTVQMEDVDDEVMETVLELMYIGKVEPPTTSSSVVLKTLTTVHLLDIKGGASYLCRQWMLKGNMAYFKLFWDWADEFNEENVRDTIVEEVATNFRMLPKCFEFVKLSPERMKSILIHPKLNVGKCQDLLVHVILSWVNAEPKARKIYLDKFVAYVDVHTLSDPCREQLVREKPVLQFFCEMKKALKSSELCVPLFSKGQLAPLYSEEKKLKQAMRKELRKVDTSPSCELNTDRNSTKWLSLNSRCQNLCFPSNSPTNNNKSSIPSTYCPSSSNVPIMAVGFQEALQDDLCNVLLVAGRGEMNCFTAHIYLPSRGIWSMGQVIPTLAVQKRSCAYCRGNLYFVGGEDSKDDLKLPHLYIYNIRSGVLTTGPPLRVPRCQAGVCIWRQMIFVAGGLNRFNKAMTHVEAFDTTSNVWRLIPPMRWQRYCPGMTILKDVLYMVGGYTTRCESYHLEKDSSWTEMPNLPECYREIPMVATHHNDQVIAFRDFRPERVCLLDRARGEWRVMRTGGSPPCGIEDSFTYHGELYALDTSGKLHVLDLEVLVWDQSVACPRTLIKAFHINSINLDEVNTLVEK